MRDYNFFEYYSEEQKKEPTGGRWAAIIGGALIVLLLAWFVYGYMEIKTLENELITMQDEIHRLKVENDYDAIDRLEIETRRLENELGTLKLISESLNKENVITPYLIETIARCKPDAIYFKSIEIDGTSISLEGNSTNRASIAQIEHNVRNVGYFENVFIPYIIEEDSFHSFLISFNLKRGGMLNDIE